MKLAIPQHKRYGRWLKPAILCNIDCSFATVRYDIYCTVCVLYSVQCTSINILSKYALRKRLQHQFVMDLFYSKNYGRKYI